MELVKLFDIDEEKCVNCHQCIAVCPAKFANDATGELDLSARHSARGR